MTPNKPVTTVGMAIRRSGAKLRALSQAHSPLHVLLWQAKETERALQLGATAQKTLFSDVASWSSNENLAISDICTNFSELSALASIAQLQLAQAYKAFRKDMNMVLEGEKRADVAQRKFQEAEIKRHKARRMVLQAQNRTQVTGMSPQTSSDYPQLQTQLAEAERHAERAHMSSCEAKSESEAMKLVILRSTLQKLSQSHMTFAHQLQSIFTGGQQLAHQIPDPPPPGDHLSCIRYTGFESSRNILGNVKSQVQILSTSPNTSSSIVSTPPRSSSQLTSNSLSSPSWATPSPSAPENPFLTSESHDLPPPYNTTVNRTLVRQSSTSSVQPPPQLYRHYRSPSAAPLSPPQNVSVISHHRRSGSTGPAFCQGQGQIQVQGQGQFYSPTTPNNGNDTGRY